MHALEHATSWIIGVISHFGYVGLFIGMFSQAVGIPLSSEVQLAFAGYLASTRVLEIIPVMIAGAAGDIFGAILAYFIGYYGGRPFLMRFGRFFFVHEREIARADEWFARYGSRAVLVLKLLPGVRAFGSFPAGVTRMAFGTFLGWTTLGASIWSVFFVGVGYLLGRNWVLLGGYARPIALILLGLVVVAIIGWILLHIRAERRKPQV